MNYPKFIVSNQKEEFISIQRVKKWLYSYATFTIIMWTDPFYTNK